MGEAANHTVLMVTNMRVARVVSCGAHGGCAAPGDQELRHAWVVIPNYETHYEKGVITEDSTLMEVIFDNRLCDYKAGAAETTDISKAQMSNIKKDTCIIYEEAEECNLRELLRIKRGQI